jgi:hypothetical protein
MQQLPWLGCVHRWAVKPVLAYGLLLDNFTE